MGSQSDTSSVPPNDDEYELETWPGEWEVERILERRLRGNWPYYHVKWRNFLSNWNTWEPLDHMFNSMELVIAFEESIKEEVRAGPTWHPNGETWEHKLPVMTARGFKLLEIIRKWQKAKNEASQSAESPASVPSNGPLELANDHAPVQLPTIPPHTARERMPTETEGVEPLGPISNPNFSMYDEVTQFIELESQSSSGQYLASIETATDRSLTEREQFVASGMTSADGETRALNFASSACPWVRTASDIKCRSDSVSRRQSQAGSSDYDCGVRMLEVGLNVQINQVVNIQAGRSRCAGNLERFPVYKQKKSCRRRRKWRQNLRRRKAKAKRLMSEAPN